jgi:hypothetical protein
MEDFLTLPFVEVEIRLGTNQKHFDSSVDKRYFEKLLSVLETGEWKSINKTETVEYIKGNTRIISPSNKVILKENVITKTHVMDDLPFDIRFSINQEFAFDSFLTNFDKTDSVVRTKNRKSFVSDHYRYDLTIVSQKINGITTLKHEIEIELLITPETLCWSSKYINDFLVCKVYDLANIVEPIESLQLNLLD